MVYQDLVSCAISHLQTGHSTTQMFENLGFHDEFIFAITDSGEHGLEIRNAAEDVRDELMKQND